MTTLEKDLREVMDTNKRIGIVMFNRDKRNNISSQIVARGRAIKIKTNFCEGFKLIMKDTTIDILNAKNYELVKLKNNMCEIVDKKKKNEVLIFLSIWEDEE